MSIQQMLKGSALPGFLEKLRAADTDIIAPVKKAKGIYFDHMADPSHMELHGIQTMLTAKWTVFPPYEAVLQFSLDGGEVAIDEPRYYTRKTIIFGARPCGARAFEILEALFTADPVDEYYKSRHDNLAIIGMSCSSCDEYCFCTSMGGGPGDTRGSDILLTEVKGDYLVEVLTPKGEELARLTAEFLTEAPAGVTKGAHLAEVKPRFKAEQVKEKLEAIFEHELWAEQSLRCLGCGACAYVCPACSCYDLQDEVCGGKGARVRCWDSCGFSRFTLHTSGHNPREIQRRRWRQRVMHKFLYQPEQLGMFGCTGCGRCSRACPVDMNLAEHLVAIVEEKRQ